MRRAIGRRVAGAKHFRDLVAWQLSRELARAVYALLDRPAVQRSFAFRDQVDDAAASVSRNIAEESGTGGTPGTEPTEPSEPQEPAEPTSGSQTNKP